MDLLQHLPSPISPSFSEALRIDTQAGCWIFVAGQVGVPLPPDKGSVTFEQEVRTTFERIRDSLSKLGAGMNHVVSIKTYLTDLGPYAVFSRIRGEFFPKAEVGLIRLRCGDSSVCQNLFKPARLLKVVAIDRV